MPIGFTSGGGGKGAGSKAAVPLASAPVKAFPDFDEPTWEPVWEPIWEPVWPSVRDIAQEAVAAVVATLVPVTVEVYTVRSDGRACPECGPYDGSLWDEGDGPQPPLHPNCRCRRLSHHTEWRTPR